MYDRKIKVAIPYSSLNSGEEVWNRTNSHLHKINSGDLEAVLGMIDSLDRDFIVESVDTGSYIGESVCVPTTEKDIIVFAQRKGRDGLTRFVKGRKPVASSHITVILKKRTEGGYVLITAFIGQKSEPEPWDKNATSESLKFWSQRALIWGSEATIPGTETTVSPDCFISTSTPSVNINRILSSLEEDFININDIARIISLAFISKKNCIIYGAGGHGKSEMMQKVITSLSLQEETFFQFFGEGMDEAKLFGGLNFKKLEEEKVLEYYPEKSFLNSRIAVFEELFDAPASVLLSLKDVLTAKELRNGSQKFKMSTEVIFCLTNKEPKEISELGPAAHALIERFPLQLNLKWGTYESKDYLSLFQKVSKRIRGVPMNGFASILAEILSKSTAEGNFISPRTAVHAYQVCQASCQLRGGSEVEKQDMTDLRFIPGLEGLAETIQKDLEVAMEKAQAEKTFSRLESEFSDLCYSGEKTSNSMTLLKVAKSLTALEDKVSDCRVPDSLSDRKKKLREKIQNKVSEFKTEAFKNA